MAGVASVMERTGEVTLPTTPAAPPSQRLLSLDVFRGITIAGMVLVNNPGGDPVYTPLEHANWNGWTPTDLIFPFFVFIVGVAMTYSFGKLLERGAPRGELMLKACKRAAMIFAMGLAIAGFASPDGLFTGYHLEHIRVLGVLQRIAIAYLVTSMLYLYTKSWKSRALWGAGILLAYWALMALVQVPGVGAPDFSVPGKNISNWLDLRIIGGDHLYHETRPWDPEGVLSTMGAIGTCIIGALAGQLLRSRRTPEQKTNGLFVMGCVMLAVGLMWGGAFPINKKIWTSSYVIFTGGFASTFLAFCYWTADVKGWRWWTRPFVVYGTNALALYFLSAIVTRLIIWVIPSPAGGGAHFKDWLYETAFVPFFSPINASLAWALFYVLAWLGIMWIFYAKRIFIKV